MSGKWLNILKVASVPSLKHTRDMTNAELELFWMRHSKTKDNLESTFTGRNNEEPLIAEGIEQSKRLGYFLANQGIFPSVVYVTPALRTIQTAEYALAEMGLDLQLLVQDELQELDEGDWIGLVRDDVYADKKVIAEMARLGRDFKRGGAESNNDAALRALGWKSKTFDGYIPDTNPDRRFVFAHAGIIVSMVSHYLNWSVQETRPSRIPNASITLTSRRNRVWELDYFGTEPDQGLD